MQKLNKMLPEVRELLLRVADGCEKNQVLMMYLMEIYNRKDKIQMLKWLIASRLTGPNLVGWIHSNKLQKPSDFVDKIVQNYNVMRTMGV